MSSSKASSSKTSSKKEQDETSVKCDRPKQLIPDRNKYVYKPALMDGHLKEVVAAARKKGVDVTPPQSKYSTGKLVHSLCSAAKAKAWGVECERALENCLALREHHRAFITHNLFFTMIGAIVARALEEDTAEKAAEPGSSSPLKLDLLADRYYVRGIVCHDSSKTSAIEAAAYSGIMSVHMEAEAVAENDKRRKSLNARCKRPNETCASQNPHSELDLKQVKEAMADFGLAHHYEENQHHLEHFPEGKMEPLNVIEAIVDGLACVFERVKSHKDVGAWLAMFNSAKFTDYDNRRLAEGTLAALRKRVTKTDYDALVEFRTVVHALLGESVPWKDVRMSDCCRGGRP